jgi:hypothetical protein
MVIIIKSEFGDCSRKTLNVVDVIPENSEMCETTLHSVENQRNRINVKFSYSKS